MRSRTRIPVALAALGLTLAPAAPAAPSSVPAALKTLDSILGSADLPASGTRGGVQPLHSAVAAADALLRSLDPGGLSGASLERVEGAEGAVGTGILLGRRHGYPVVAGVVPGSPAWYQPVWEGDRILTVDDTPVDASISLEALEARLAGKPDESVEVLVLHEKNHQTSRVSLKHAAPEAEVHVRTLVGEVAYVSFSGLSPMVLAEYTLQVGKLGGRDLLGTVLDLRGVQGGTVQDAVTLVEPFLGAKAVATTVRTGGSDTVKASAKVVHRSPLVVVVDAATRGAAEVAAAALQAHKRGLILGATTQGRALAYRHQQSAGVHLTLPEAVLEVDGGSFATGRGIVPDIAVSPPAVPRGSAKAYGGQRVAFAKGIPWVPETEESEKEKVLEEVLGEGGDEESPDEPDGSDEGTLDAPADPFHDYPLVKRYDLRLVRAVHLLKAASIFFHQSRSGD